MVADKPGHTKIAQKLIKQGANINATNKDGDSVLNIKILHTDNKKIINFLKFDTHTRKEIDISAEQVNV